MATDDYHYTECGLDNVYLMDGYKFVDAPGGRQVVISDIDGLHELIGRTIVEKMKDLSGKEIKFLRHEMLMSQATLAKLLNVSEQAIRRWENGKTTQVPKPAEALIRLLYKAHIADNQDIKSSLRKIADLEDEMHRNLVLKNTDHNWRIAA